MSLATRVFLLMVLVALPIFAIVVAQEVQLRAARRAEIVEETPAAATLAASRQARVISSAQTLLALAARIPAVRTLAPGECTRELARLAATLPGINGLAAISPNGTSYCSNNTDGTTAQVADRPYFQD